jgi:hypothetical protein
VSYKSVKGLFVGVTLSQSAKVEMNLAFAPDEPEMAAVKISQSPLVKVWRVSSGTPYVLKTVS